MGLKWYRKIVGLVPKPPDLAYISLAHSTTLLITSRPIHLMVKVDQILYIEH